MYLWACREFKKRIGWILLNKDKNLLKILTGKKIAYVCPGQHLIGHNLGKEIDSHDIIVRVNQKFAIPSTKIKDYGGKTDIIFSAFSGRCIYECKNNWDFFKNNKELKAGVVSQLPDVSSMSFKSFFEQKLKIPYIVFDRKDIMDIYKYVGTN